MKKLLISIFLSTVISSSALAERFNVNTTSLPATELKYKDSTINCGIKFGDAGRDSPWIKIKNNNVTRVNNIGGPWSFIRETYGPCSFMVYNKDQYQGRHVNYGSGLFKNAINSASGIRAGAVATKNKGGWKVRSVIISPHIKTACQVTLRDNRKTRLESGKLDYVRQVFYGPSHISDITGWSIVSKTSGNNSCSYTLYNEKDFSGNRTNFGKVNKAIREGWRIRSLEISQQ